VKEYWHVAVGVCIRNVIQLRRYFFNTASELVLFYVIFLLIFYGAKAVGGSAISAGETLEGIIVGYFLWMLSIYAYGDMSSGIAGEAQMGTLEQLYLCPAGFWFVNACSVAVNLIACLLMSAVLLLAAMVSTGKWLQLDLISILPVVLLTLVAPYGVGFIVGGLALVFKRVQVVFQIVQFLFLGFLLIPLTSYPAARYLPLAMGNVLVRRIMVDGLRLWELPAAELAVLAATGIFYLVLGIAIYRHSLSCRPLRPGAHRTS